ATVSCSPQTASNRVPISPSLGRTSKSARASQQRAYDSSSASCSACSRRPLRSGSRLIESGANQRCADPLINDEVDCARTCAARSRQAWGSPIWAPDAMIAAALTSDGCRRHSSSPTAPPRDTPAYSTLVSPRLSAASATASASSAPVKLGVVGTDAPYSGKYQSASG